MVGKGEEIGDRQLLREKNTKKKGSAGFVSVKYLVIRGWHLDNKERMGRKRIRERHKQQGRMTEEREMEAARWQEEQLLITPRWICCGQ